MMIAKVWISTTWYFWLQGDTKQKLANLIFSNFSSHFEVLDKYQNRINLYCNRSTFYIIYHVEFNLNLACSIPRYLHWCIIVLNHAIKGLSRCFLEWYCWYYFGKLLIDKLAIWENKIRGVKMKIWEFCMILEYFSLAKGPFTGPLGRLEKSLDNGLLRQVQVHSSSCNAIFCLEPC